MNCHARSKQNRLKVSQKNAGKKVMHDPEVLPNDNRKPPSHVWKRFKKKF